MEEDLYYTLIYRQLEGEITASEEAQLGEWIDSSPANRQTYNDVTEAWTLSQGLSAQIGMDLDEEYSLLEKRIKSARSPTRIRLYWAAAAGFVLLVVAGMVATRIFGGEREQNWVELTSEQGNRELVLEDQTTVVLAEGSTLRYPEKFRGKDRPVEMEGVAYFKVAQKAGQPFRITTPVAEITVLGTEFNVSAPKGGKLARVAVTSGKVQLRPLVARGDQVLTNGTGLTLEKGEMGTYDRETGILKKGIRFPVNETAWMTGKLTFEETPLAQVIEEVGQYFQTEISLEDSLLNRCSFTAKFENPKLEAVLETIAAVFGGTVEIINGKYQLKGGGC